MIEILYMLAITLVALAATTSVTIAVIKHYIDERNEWKGIGIPVASGLATFYGLLILFVAIGRVIGLDV